MLRDPVFLILVGAPVAVLAVWTALWIALLVLRIAGWTIDYVTETSAGIRRTMTDMHFEMLHRRAAARWRRTWNDILNATQHTGGPDRQQVERMRDTARAQELVRLFQGTLIACHFAHEISAEAHNVDAYSDPRVTAACAGRRRLVNELLHYGQEELSQGAAAIDPDFLKTSALVEAISGFCGERCHLLNLSRNEAPRPCTPVSLLTGQCQEPRHDPD